MRSDMRGLTSGQLRLALSRDNRGMDASLDWEDEESYQAGSDLVADHMLKNRPGGT